MAASAAVLLSRDGVLIVEIGATQVMAARPCLERAGLAVTEVRRDLGGRDRCLVARLL
jgi:methylase of polypeptide subunit release factors